MTIDISKSLLDAISIIANRTVEEVSSDKTIKAIVKKVVSTSENKYLVNYNNGDFYAYIQSGSTDVYQIGEQVYVLVPEGDMGQKKFIIGKVEDNKEYVSNILTSSLLNDYVMIGDNAVIEKEYPVSGGLNIKKMQPLGLNSHDISDFHYCYLRNPNAIEGLPADYDTITSRTIDIDEETFINSAKQAKALLLRAKFKANIDINTIGNYGIIVNIAFADETNPQIDDDGNITYPPKLVAYVLDTSKMTGNPMKFYDYSSQYTIGAFDGENYLYIDSIVAFSEGFVNQSTQAHNEYDDTYIYIDDFEIIALDEVSATNGDYKLKLITPKGNTIKSGQKDTLTINAIMTYLDKDITKNTDFYWGVKDSLITPSHDLYNAKLGSGYRYIKAENELILTPADLTAAKNIYVCVAVYESSIILKTSISLYNNNNKIEITIDSDQGTIFQFNEGNPTLTCSINGKTANYQKNYPDSAFTFVWSKEDADFGTILLDKTEAQLEIDKTRELEECNDNGISTEGRTAMQVLSYYSTRIAQIKDVSYPNGVHGAQINCKLKNTNAYVIYSCSVYRSGVYIGYASITLQNHKNVINNNYYVTITNGTQVFQYDEAGVAPNSQKHQEPIEVLDLIAVFHSPQGSEVTPKKVRWIIPQGKTLINIPSLGLETDPETGERYFIGNIYPLNIKDIYDNTCNDNQVIAVVTHADGTEYRQSSNLLFTKIGEIGTNGTDTVVKINEKIEVPKDECLTIIKPAIGDAIYNSNNKDIVANTPVLEASLYTNNTQILGHKTEWTIAGGSSTQGYNYQVSSNDDNTCIIEYNGNNKKLDTRIVKAQTSLKGKYFNSFYSIPAIEYSSEYNYANYPIKIMRDGTLKSILYDSSGMNPSYNENQGVHIELPGWVETGFLEWRVESGLKTGASYDNPNLLIAKSPKSKTGSRELKTTNNIGDIQTAILQAQDCGKSCANNATADIKKYINDFIIDIEKTGIDNLLSTPNKLNILWNRLANFNSNAPDKNNVYIKTVYKEYYTLFEQMDEEYQLCKDINKKCTEVHDMIQTIWNSEWPSVIVDSELHVQPNINIANIQELIDKYKQAYNDRSNNENDAIKMPVRNDTYDSEFRSILSNYLDKYYNNYKNINTTPQNDILVEYTKVLMAYINLLIDKTQSCFNTTYPIYYEDEQLIDFQNLIKNKYSIAYSDWSLSRNKTTYTQGDVASDHTIGQIIYDIVNTANESIAAIYDNVRELYHYYQTLYLSVNKYQIAEESQTLNAWNAMLNGYKPDLLNHIYIIPNNFFNGLYMNNNIVGTVFVQENNVKHEVAKIYIPIIMTLNTYSLSALNGWDGTSIDIGDDHIMTPQIGAGIKDSATNTFTGMVMGSIGNTAINASKSKQINKIGLMGYSNGKQSVFINSKTGEAVFGLPENNTDTDEGCIKLIPGGISEIGNWKIGNRFLYNIINGSYEKRKDPDMLGQSNYKLMVPHDKYGIILSSDKPYIHIKGQVYEGLNLKGIDYNDEYNNINPGDSLELRLDPNNNSLFSIIQHTAGLGDEDAEDLFFGYKSSGSNSITVVKNYIANQNIAATEQIGDGAEYYIYRLATVNNQYQPYYQKDDGSKILKQTTFLTNAVVENTDIYLKNSISQNNFQNAFNIDSNTGIITYNPDNLIWEENSNSSYWHSITSKISSRNAFNVDLNYSKNINEILNNNIVIGKIKNITGYSIYKVAFNYSMNLELININLNNSNCYIQFYLVNEADQDEDIDNALLKSQEYNILNTFNNTNIELFSYNDHGLSNNNSYWLKAKIYINNYTINGNYSYPINYLAETYKEPPNSSYGTVKKERHNMSLSNQKCDFDSIDPGSKDTIEKTSVCYRIQKNSNDFFLQLFFSKGEPKEYDFIVWKEKESDANKTIIGVGQTVLQLNSSWKFFEFNSNNNIANTSIESIKINNIIEEWAIPEEDFYESVDINKPLCVSFYPKGSLITTVEEYNTENGATNTSITTTTTYILNTPSISDKTIYSLNLGDSIYYNSVKISCNLNLTNINVNNIFSFIPQNIDMLCIEGDTNMTGIQGIPYAKTYWDNNNNQKVRFYKSYYDWVNSDINKKQYGYIDVDNSGNIYYKYIKTLMKDNVNNWFTTSLTGINHSEDKTTITIDNQNIDIYNWVEAFTEDSVFENIIYWKEFIRVGLDENGRFFNAGLQDKKTYSRTGRIYGFGKVPNLYGQEIRTQQLLNTYAPIIKIFAQNQDLNTTYITQGKNDNGNISIRTAEAGHYVELAASESSENNTNSIPDKTSYIKVSYNNGIQIESKDQNIVNSINLTSTQGLIINTSRISILSNNVQHQIADNYTWVKSPLYLLSSLPSWSIDNAYNGFLGNDNENAPNAKGHYRIKAFSDGHDPTIKLQVGQNEAGVDITAEKINLKASNSRFIEINSSINSNLSGFVVDDMRLQFQGQTVLLQNMNSHIAIVPNDDYSRSIWLYSNLSGRIEIADNVTIKGYNGFVVSDGPAVFEKYLHAKMNLYTNNNLYVGYNPETYTSQTGSIYLYKDNSNYVRLFAEHIHQLFDWYNNKRWMIGCSGNTLWLKSVSSNSNPEGRYNASTGYTWNWKTFSNYSNY